MSGSPDLVSDHNEQVGLLCTQWAYLEWLLEIFILWSSDLLNAHEDGWAKATSGKSIAALAIEVVDNAHRKLTSTKEVEPAFPR